MGNNITAARIFTLTPQVRSSDPLSTLLVDREMSREGMALWGSQAQESHPTPCGTTENGAAATYDKQSSRECSTRSQSPFQCRSKS
jgi:hypothetical protein